MNYQKLITSLKPYIMSYHKLYSQKAFLAQREQYVRHLCWQYNLIDPNKRQLKHRILTKILNKNNQLIANSPFHCDYGFNIHCRGKVFFNYNDTVLDSSPVIIGNGTIVAPNVCISCVGHPLYFKQRKQGMSVSQSITIGDYVWIGANTFIKGGVKIGQHSVIGAGSVVTHDIPKNVVAFGVPCKVHRKITQSDIIPRQKIK